VNGKLFKGGYYMQIQERIKELEEKRALAQSWFMEQEKRKVSSNYDNRETAGVSILSIETFISFYEVMFNRKPASVLDIGCGQGQVLEYLSEHLPHANLVGIDSSKEAIEHANQLKIDANFICAEIENPVLDISGETYDVIFIHLCFGLFKYPLEVLEGVLSYMSDESLIYIVDLNKDSVAEGTSSAKSREEELYLYDQYNASFTLSEFKHLLLHITEQRKELSFKVGTSFIGGINQFSLEFVSLIGKKGLQQALRNISEKENGQKNSMPELIHAWLIKKKDLHG
jgi:SAM-dependent methyltransferase